MRDKRRNNLLAGIEYAGVAGSSKDCQDAVMRLLQYGDQISPARIFSCSGTHCLLLTVNVGDLVAVKSGFGSGYRGEGARTFSYVLALLHAHGAEIEEYEVDEDVIERLDNSCLRRSDIEKLNAAHPVRPTRWQDYVFDNHFDDKKSGALWEEFDPVIPFAIIDTRIIELAISFWQAPSDKLLTGYRRLEDIVRKRTGINEHSVRLFSQAFQGEASKLGWKKIDSSEQAARGSLFKDVYMAYRNPRAHRELEENASDQLAEFLLLNHLYLLEKTASEQSDG